VRHRQVTRQIKSFKTALLLFLVVASEFSLYTARTENTHDKAIQEKEQNTKYKKQILNKLPRQRLLETDRMRDYCSS